MTPGTRPAAPRCRSTALGLACALAALVPPSSRAQPAAPGPTPVAPPAAAAGPTAEAWKLLRPGLEHRSLPPSPPQRPFGLDLLRVDLRRFRLVAADARRTPGRKHARVEVLRREHDGVAAVNGTFFDPADRPLGLLVDAGVQLNPLRRADWGVFWVDGGVARVVHTSTWRARHAHGALPEFALQVGPRLLDAGRPLRLKRQLARRTVLGVDPSGRVVLGVTTAGLAESNALARLAATAEERGGLGWRDGLMLDGGPSTQLDVAVGAFRLHHAGGWGVPNAVVVVPR